MTPIPDEGPRRARRGLRADQAPRTEDLSDPSSPVEKAPPARRAEEPEQTEAAPDQVHPVRSAARVGALRAVGFAVLALAVGIGSALIPGQQASTTGASAVVPGQTLVCSPSLQNAAVTAASTSRTLRIGALGGSDREVPVPASESVAKSAAVVRSVSGQGRPAATTMSVVGSGAGATSSWTNCSTASTGGTLIVEDPSISDIVVTNPEADEASVDVTLSGAKGVINATGTRGLTVPARSSRVLPLSVWVSGRSPVAATLSTDTSRVVAVARTSGPNGSQAFPMSSAAQNLWIPAVPSQVSASELLVTNPSSSRATVKVTAMAAGGAFVPEGADEIEVEPYSTITVDLGKALAGEAVGLSVNANVAVGAQVRVTKGKDITMATPAAAATSLQSALPRGGTVSLSNPTNQVAQVTGSYRTASGATTSFTASLPASSTWTKDLGGTGGHLLVSSDHAIIGGVWYTGAGLSSVPMSVVSGAGRVVRLSVDPQLS
ncbi:DUF5719 family protein [Acidipropionibacterium thoenii]|uniref:DUF5719 family protein n=1 Tax=Acidipropionibacterium thoenii TaxID=1751 RepID=UPI0004011305|nr:DUF5719 family protein [Acidipropionibacterium thoenii]